MQVRLAVQLDFIVLFHRPISLAQPEIPEAMCDEHDSDTAVARHKRA